MSNIRAKRVSNYELFFDLVIVLAIGELTSAIHLDSVGLEEIYAFIISNIIMLNLWNNEVFYFNKYGDSRRIDIFTIIPLMFVIGNIALNLNMDWGSLAGNHAQIMIFNLLLMIAYGIIALQFYLKGRIRGFSTDIKTSIISNIIYGLVVLPFVFDFLPVSLWSVLLYLTPNVVPFFTKKYHTTNRLNFPHGVERAQLVTILTFGESVIAIITTYPLTENLYQGALLFFGMALMFMFYMTQTFLSLDHHRRAYGSLLFYAHLPIIIGTNLFTVGTEFLANDHHAEIGTLLFIIGILCFFTGTLVTSYYNQKLYKLNQMNYLIYGIMLVVATVLMIISRSNIVFLSVILIVLAWSMSYYNMYTRRQARERANVPHPDPRQNPRDFS